MRIFFPAGLVVFSGLVAISSISKELFFLQLLWVFVGVGIIIFINIIDWKSFVHSAWFVRLAYGASIVLLIAVLFFGPTIRGAKSWVVIGPIQFQPVEFAKLGLILVLAAYFRRRHVGIGRFKNIFFSFLLFVFPFLLTILQPDLGSGIILVGIWLGFLFVTGIPKKWIFTGVALFAVLFLVAWNFLFLKFQKERIISLFDPSRDELGVSYSVIQSKIAIGSAGLWGKGYSQGTQTQLGFLTDPATDFILPAFIEEWGVVAGTILILAFVLLVFQILRNGFYVPSNFEKFICFGSAIVFSLHFLVNAGSAVGIFPVAGVPFPLMSYGGSHFLSISFLLGLVFVIGKRA